MQHSSCITYIFLVRALARFPPQLPLPVGKVIQSVSSLLLFLIHIFILIILKKHRYAGFCWMCILKTELLVHLPMLLIHVSANAECRIKLGDLLKTLIRFILTVSVSLKKTVE